MAKVEQKQPIVAEISEAIKDAASIVLVTYSGITVEQDTAMRKELREAGFYFKCNLLLSKGSRYFYFLFALFHSFHFSCTGNFYNFFV